MIKIRLMRSGKNKHPFYKVIVSDARNARNGKFIEKLGFFSYSSKENKKISFLKKDRISHWIKCGAKVSKRVQSLIKHN